MNTQMAEVHSEENAMAAIEEGYPILLIGRDHRVSYANELAHRLLGYEHGGLHGLSIELLLGRRAEARNLQAVLAGEAPRRFRSALRHNGGRNLDVQLSLEPCLDLRGAVVAVKVRCEPAKRPLSSVVPPRFDPASGTRPVPKRIQVVAPAEKQPGPTPPALSFGEDAGAQLDTALQLVGWLRQRVDTNNEPLDGERARLTYLLAEVAELVAQVRCSAVRR